MLLEDDFRAQPVFRPKGGAPVGDEHFFFAAHWAEAKKSIVSGAGHEHGAATCTGLALGHRGSPVKWLKIAAKADEESDTV